MVMLEPAPAAFTPKPKWPNGLIAIRANGHLQIAIITNGNVRLPLLNAAFCH